MNHVCKIALLILLAGCSSSKTQRQINSEATVQSMNGLYIFVKSKPAHDYDFLGSVPLDWYSKIGRLKEQSLESVVSNVTSLVSFSQNLENAIKEAKQKFPTAEGLLFNDDLTQCEVIKFR